MEILNTTRFVRILAEPTWDFLLLLFLGVSLITRFENDFFQPILPTWWRPFCFGTKTPHRQWWNYCGWDNSISSLSPLCVKSGTYHRNNLLWFHTLLLSFFKKNQFITSKALDMVFSLICSGIFIDWLVYNAWHLHIFFCPSLKSICPSSFSGSSFVLSWFSKIHI